MKSGALQLNVPLSHLIPSRRNPRKVKPGRDAHHRLVAGIRSQGLLQPLVVRPLEGKPKHYEVVAGFRRLKALQEIHRGNGDPKIPCILRDVDTATADAMSLGENFSREAMHPLDEAEAFAKLATGEGKDAKAIAAEFGVSEHYVRQRMKLATLADPVKATYREGKIDTATAEAFAAVPEDRQLEVWKEVNGNPRHADHVRNVIAHAWVEAKHAVFDLSTLPPSAISQDLFGDRVLVERRAFMEAQVQALAEQRQAMIEVGWAEVVAGRREDVQDQLYSMEQPEREFDEQTKRQLATLAVRRQKLEKAAKKIDQADHAKVNRLQQRFEALESKEQEIIEKAPEHFSEETKAMARSFLILDPDGRVYREYRLLHRRGKDQTNGDGEDSADKRKPPTSDDLSDRQLATTFTHQALAVREALLESPVALRRVLALILHEKVRSESLAIRHEANAITLHASSDGFKSSAFDRLREKREKLDPFSKQHYVEDVKAYEQFAKLPAAKLNSLIDHLIVDCITSHLQREMPLVKLLAAELKINIRHHWKPDAEWLSSFQKIQLGYLIVELLGKVNAPSPERKKSELVEVVAKLFADAAEAKLEDKQLADRLNTWVPSNLREVKRVAKSQLVRRSA